MPTTNYLDREARLSAAYIGTFNAIASVLFPSHYDSHVVLYRQHRKLAADRHWYAAAQRRSEAATSAIILDIRRSRRQ